ncbi:MAG: hypothetical protein MUF16_25570 [Burkholderiaceae bacterium]|jgi:hypothetical protein|nr:hypothetical protein [Burkholderiaceae bacterium]
MAKLSIPWTTGLRRLAISALVASALLGAAQAQVLDFRGVGFVQPTALPDLSGNVPLAVLPQSSAYDFGEGMFGGYYDLTSNFVFNLGSGTGSGFFTFTKGADSFSGTIATSATATGFSIDYTVLSGLGLFAGLSGNGNGVVTALDPLTSPTVRYFENGSITLVPEPATWLMWLAGGALLLGAARIQRQR